MKKGHLCYIVVIYTYPPDAKINSSFGDHLTQYIELWWPFSIWELAPDFKSTNFSFELWHPTAIRQCLVATGERSCWYTIPLNSYSSTGYKNKAYIIPVHWRLYMTYFHDFEKNVWLLFKTKSQALDLDTISILIL